MGTETILIPRRDPIHLWLGDTDLATPTLVSATLEDEPAAFASLLNRSSQNFTSIGPRLGTDGRAAAPRAESTNAAAIVGWPAKYRWV